MKSVEKKTKKYAVVSDECVACGTCLFACSFGAISIENGIKAIIETEMCKGCAKCVKICPASVIKLEKEDI